ncbi:MAG: hypothetical protein ABSA51_04305 [Anaerolineaceae bacterium]
MDETLLEVSEYTGEGFQPLVYFGAWRVAVLNYLDGLRPENQKSVERHTETDEVFILMKGTGTLFLGKGDKGPEALYPQAMDVGKIYNVKKDIWHTVVISPDASVLLVENGDTAEANSEYADLTSQQCRLIIDQCQTKPRQA